MILFLYILREMIIIRRLRLLCLNFDCLLQKLLTWMKNLSALITRKILLRMHLLMTLCRLFRALRVLIHETVDLSLAIRLVLL